MADVDTLLPVLIVAVVLIGGIINVVRSVRKRMRRNKRAQDGVQSEAEVVAVGEPSPPEQTEAPFTLRYFSPDGRQYERDFTRGFRGIVPVPGWRVRVLFDPEDPGNIEITDNPYLHPIPGASPPQAPRPVLRYIAPPVSALAIALYAYLSFSAFSSGGTLLPVAVGGLFTLVGLVFLFIGIGVWRSQRRLREEPAHTTGTVTHSWQETRRRRDSDGGTTYRTFYPYTVHYVLPDGRHVHKRSPSSSGQRVRAVGERTQVLYDPSDPTSFDAEGSSASTVLPLVLLGFGIVFPLLGSTIAVVSRLAS
ncbi:DUF3592 domain-containing protein [Nocardiopsis halophila]|uniref:DUF3592 domain-containing protein n=1 Tax=Nocardiopsis halophila TaxID=141692 RepID=UPI000345011B|nr:DUF3592 domain-containing protein [Nocardiopsis halophila]